MEYVIDYSAASLLYIGVILWFYMGQKQVPNLRSHIFKIMLIVGFISVFLDISTALMNRNADVFFAWFVWLVNFVFLLATQAEPLLFFCYIVALCNNWKKKTKLNTILALCPYFVSVILLCISSLGRFGAFYIGEDNIYHHGTTHFILYIVALTYILMGIVIVFNAREKIDKNKKRVICFFILVTVIAMIIQYINSKYLLSASANALAIMMIYCALELPSDNRDSLTGAFNRMAATVLMEDLYQRHQQFSVEVVSMKTFKAINQQFGNKIGDVILKGVYEYLQKNNPSCNIFRCYGDVFCIIIINKDMDIKELTDRYHKFPRVWNMGGADVHAKFKIACIKSQYCENSRELFSTLDYIMEEFHQTEARNVLMADHDFYTSCLEKSNTSSILENAILNNSIEIYYQPIHCNERRIVSLEALSRLFDDKNTAISPDIFIKMAEQNGSIIKLGEQVLRKVCQFIKANDIASKGINYISVNLSIVQCMQENLIDDFWKIVNEYDVKPQLICFEITETVAVDSFELVRKTIKEFLERGFHFSLDDFGTGYANFQYIAEFPFTNVKVDKTLLWSAISNERQMKLLESIITVLHNMGFPIICEGVETKEEVEILDKLGVEMHQGFYYSKALPYGELLEYISKCPLKDNILEEK